VFPEGPSNVQKNTRLFNLVNTFAFNGKCTNYSCSK